MVCRQTNHGACQLKKPLVAPLQLFIATRQLTKEVQPPMTSFDHPSPSRRRFRQAVCRRATLLQGRSLPRLMGGLPRGGARIAFIAAQILRRRCIGRRSPKDAPGQCLRHQRNLWRFGAADDQRQGDTSSVHQQTPLASMFSPDPSGVARQPLAPTARCSPSRHDAAISRRDMTSRHPPRGQPARGVRTIRRLVSASNVDEWRWGAGISGSTRCHNASETSQDGDRCFLFILESSVKTVIVVNRYLGIYS